MRKSKVIVGPEFQENMLSHGSKDQMIAYINTGFYKWMLAFNLEVLQGKTNYFCLFSFQPMHNAQSVNVHWGSLTVSVTFFFMMSDPHLATLR